MSKIFSALLLLSSCLLWSGCASYSGIAPEARTFDAATLKGSGPASLYHDWPKLDWWRDLGDAVLTRLVEQALVDHPTVLAATAKLNRAKSFTGLAESSLRPQLGASASLTRERFSERGLIPPPYAGSTQNLDDVQFAGQWELDFFGRNREGLSAALGELRATEVEHFAARMLLATAVTRSYYNLARLLSQREIAERRSSQRAELAALVELRYKAGLDTRIELETARSLVPENARDSAALDEQIGLARHALAALTGQGPEAMNGVAPSLPAVAPLSLPTTLPATLLGHRADVVAARWRVDAALHGLESTKALFYPNINLRAFTGFSAIGFDRWLDAGSRQPGIGLAINLPLFDADRLRSLYRANAALADAAIATYNSTLLDALREVADQLSTLQALDNQLARQQSVLASASRNYDLSLQRYQAGISDRLTVLNMETNLIAQRRIAVDLQAAWIDHRIRLIRALGGGFAETSVAPTASPANSALSSSEAVSPQNSNGQPS